MTTPEIQPSTALVPVDMDRCPECSGELVETTMLQPALLRHGGHGATVRYTKRACPTCRYSIDLERQEVRPVA